MVIENTSGEIEEKKYSDTDAEIIFAKGVEKGRAEEARKQTAPPEFYDADGYPRWNEIAVFCQKQQRPIAKRLGAGVCQRHGRQDAVSRAERKTGQASAGDLCEIRRIL